MPTTETSSGGERKILYNNVEEGKRWYQKISEELEKKYFGEYIVINTENGEYVVNEDGLRALDLGDAKFPKGRTYFTRIGLPNPFFRFHGG